MLFRSFLCTFVGNLFSFSRRDAEAQSWVGESFRLWLLITRTIPSFIKVMPKFTTKPTFNPERTRYVRSCLAKTRFIAPVSAHKPTPTSQVQTSYESSAQNQLYRRLSASHHPLSHPTPLCASASLREKTIPPDRCRICAARSRDKNRLSRRNRTNRQADQ